MSRTVSVEPNTKLPEGRAAGRALVPEVMTSVLKQRPVVRADNRLKDTSLKSFAAMLDGSSGLPTL